MKKINCKRLLLISFLLIFIAPGIYSTEKRRPMTVDDGLNMVRVGNPVMSPDGKWVLFSKSELNWSKNKRKITYYMIPAEGGEEFQYIGETGGNSFRFSSDGKYLAFLRTIDKKQQIFIMRTSGGEAIQLTKHKTSISSFKWSPDSKKIFFLAPDARTEEEEKKYKAGYDALFIDEGPNGQVEGRWQNLWMVDLKSKKEVQITKEEIIIRDFDISPDGKCIIFKARYENRRNQEYLSEIYLFDLEKKKKIRLTENKAPERNLQWAPNGKIFAYIAPDNKKWELRQSKIWIMNPETKEYRMISGKFNGRIRNYVWTPNSKYILFTGLERTNSNLYKINVSTGEVTQLTHVKGSLYNSSFSKDCKKMVYIFSDFNTPPDLYVSSTEKFKPIRLTNVNPWIEKEILLAKTKIIKWKSRDGLEIEGILYLPSDYKEGKKFPLILHIHGGPPGVFTNSFSYRYHMWAGLGYASLCPNVRGSSGYGDKFLRGNMYDIGGGDYWDLMTGVDYVIKKGYVDSEKIGVRGWSYGGILGAWTITQTNRFKAASLGALVSLWTSEYGAGFNYDIRLWYIGGTPWDNPEGYKKKSAFTYVKNINTPTLIMHGEKDRTCTEHQSMLLFTALKDMGKTVRYIRFPREAHGFREPRHQRTRDIEEIKWMQKYVLGIEWKPWERKENIKDKEKKSKNR